MKSNQKTRSRDQPEISSYSNRMSRTNAVTINFHLSTISTSPVKNDTNNNSVSSSTMSNVYNLISPSTGTENNIPI